MPEATDPDPRETLKARIAARKERPLPPFLHRRGLGSYRGYIEMLEAISGLVDRGARLEVVGRSVQGEPLFALRIGAEPKERASRTTASLSLVHPIEWIGFETHIALLHRLLASDLGDRTVIAFPIVNPDGVMRVEDNLRSKRWRFVRHNAHGVDLNRNFDAHWFEKSFLQSALSFLYSAGRFPASEPEVAAIAHALARLRVDRAVSLHSFGGAVLYPSAASLLPIADEGEHRAWAEPIARAASSRPYRAAACSRWSFGFTATGLDLDWFHDRHGALSLLVECSRPRLSLRPSRLFDPFAWFNPEHADETATPIAEALLPFAAGALKPI